MNLTHCLVWPQNSWINQLLKEHGDTFWPLHTAEHSSILKEKVSEAFEPHDP